jgi:hypothetical protein
MRTGTTTRVSLSTSGRQANRESHDAAFSADGRYVAFDSDATNLTPHTHAGIFVRIVR